MKLVHAADLHLDSPLRGLERYEGLSSEGVDRLRGATRRALENLVAFCLEESAEMLLLAGDLYDGDWRDYSTGLFFAAQMSRLRQTGTRVVWIRGNHDAASRLTRHLRLPEHVFELSHRKPETRVFEDLGVAVHGQGFARRAVTEDLAAGYPPPVDGALNAGLLHTSATGRPGHETYAPCRPEALGEKGYEYWALGHVHRREVLAEEPWIVFAGNLQGRSVRETGPKGATLMEVEGDRVVEVRAVALDAVRWEVCEVDLGEAADGDDAVDLARQELEQALEGADGRPLAARVVLAGSTRAHRDLLDEERWRSSVRAAATDLGDEVWLERVDFRTAPLHDPAGLAERDDPVGQVARALRRLAGDDEALLALGAQLGDLGAKLPRAAREGPEGLRLDDPSNLREALADVERMLLARLLSAGEGKGNGAEGAAERPS